MTGVLAKIIPPRWSWPRRRHHPELEPGPGADEDQRGGPGGSTPTRTQRWRRRATRGAMFLALAMMAATVTIMVFEDGEDNAGPPDLEFPPVVATASRQLDRAESADMLASMLNLTAWAGETMERALTGQGFYTAILTGPGTECGVRPEGAPPRTVDEVVRCAQAELERRSESVPEWAELTHNHRVAAAAKALEQTWWSKSPEKMMQVRTAYLRGMLLDREDEEFRGFSEPFDVCLEEAYRHAAPLARAENEVAAGRVYGDAWISMDQCASSRIAARFPKPEPEPTTVRLDTAGEPDTGQPNTNDPADDPADRPADSPAETQQVPQEQ